MPNPRLSDRNRRPSNPRPAEFWEPAQSLVLTDGGMWRAPFSGQILLVLALCNDDASAVTFRLRRNGEVILTMNGATIADADYVFGIPDQTGFSVGDVFRFKTTGAVAPVVPLMQVDYVPV